MRFHTAPVIRLEDGKSIQLGQTIKADGRWRLFAFAAADDTGQAGDEITALCSFLASDPSSPVVR